MSKRDKEFLIARSAEGVQISPQMYPMLVVGTFGAIGKWGATVQIKRELDGKVSAIVTKDGHVGCGEERDPLAAMIEACGNVPIDILPAELLDRKDDEPSATVEKIGDSIKKGFLTLINGGKVH
jgi:hypothetical protein